MVCRKKKMVTQPAVRMPPLLPRRSLLLAGPAATAVSLSLPATAAVSPPPPPPVAAARSVVVVVGGGPSSRRTLADASSTLGGTGIVVGPSTILTTSTIAAAAAASRGGVAVLSLDERGVSTARSGRVVATDPRAGIALIAVEGGEDGASPPPLTPATFAPTSSLRVGQRVFAVAASPLDGAPALAGGLVSGLQRGLPLAGGVGALAGALQTDARIVEGGALLDAGGGVIGLGVAPRLAGGGPPASVLGFALPSDAEVAAVTRMRVPV